MGTGRKMQKKPMTRPVKSALECRRRVKVQRSRLVALGMSEEVVAKMDPKDVRTALRRPNKIAAS